MKIAVLGTGTVGKALGGVLSKAGHDVIYGARTDDRAPDTVGYADAALGAEAVILAVPFAAVEAVIKAAGGLDGTILIDCTNSVGVDENGPMINLKPGTSAGEMIADLAPQAEVYKTFNQVGVEVLGHAQGFSEGAPFQLIAGPETAALKTVETIVRDAGFDPQYIGGMDQAPLVEAFAMVWIHLAGTNRTGRDWALKRMMLEG